MQNGGAAGCPITAGGNVSLSSPVFIRISEHVQGVRAAVPPYSPVRFTHFIYASSIESPKSQIGGGTIPRRICYFTP